MAHSVTLPSSQEIFSWPAAANTPAVTRRESPGREKTNEHSGLGENDHADHRNAAPFDQPAHIKQVMQEIPYEFRHAA